MGFEGTEQSGTFNGDFNGWGGIRYYQIDVTNPLSKVTITAGFSLSYIYSTTVSLELCDSNNNLITSSTGTGKSRRVTATVGPGTYYIVFEGYINSQYSAAYYVSANEDAPAPSEYCDASEGTEDTLEVGGDSKSGSLNANGELHYYQIDVTDPGIKLDIDITFGTGNGVDYVLVLCDSDDALIDSATGTSSGVASPENITAIIRSGTYYIVVGSDDSVDYSGLTATTSDYSDYCEGASSTSNIGRLWLDGHGRHESLRAGKLHYYQVSVRDPLSKVIVFTTSTVDVSSSAVSLVLCDSNNNIIASSTGTWRGRHVTTTVEQGTYYIVLEGYTNKYYSTDYYIRAGSNNCNSGQSSTILTLDGMEQSGSFNTGAEFRYYEIEVTDLLTELDIDITFGQGSGGVQYSLELCDSNDGLIDSTTGTSDEFGVSRESITATVRSGTHYIVVGGDDSISYSELRATKTDPDPSYYCEGASSASNIRRLWLGGTRQSGSFASGGGLHYYKAYLTDPLSTIDIGIIFDSLDLGHSSHEYGIHLCNSNNNLIDGSTGRLLAGRLREITAIVPSGTYYIVVESNSNTEYSRLTAEATDPTLSDYIDHCDSSNTNFPSEPLYGCQWYLKNTGRNIFGKTITAGEDINIEGVWDDDIFGAGINIAVVNDGVHIGHEDLTDNVNTSLNHHYYIGYGYHNDYSSTRVAGIIAAVGDNSLGVRGVAPEATIYNYDLDNSYNWRNPVDANVKNAMIRNKDITAVSNNNWGPDELPLLRGALSRWEEGVRTGISEGFGGKGVFYVWAAGDGHEDADQANFDEYSNYYAVTTICSVDGEGSKSSFSEEGVNLWVCAPGEHITTTESYNNGYIFDASGTAYSAAQVSGVAALMREVNGQLSWRDLKLILAASARKNDASDSGWETGALKYGSDSERYNYNPKYGFGVVDADAAVELAENWNRIPPTPIRTLTVSSSTINMTIVDYSRTGDGETISRLTISDNELFTEFVEIYLELSHGFLPDLDIQITSPAGTVSKLTEEFVSGALSTSLSASDFAYSNYIHRFGSAKHLGESSAGEWTLKISDFSSEDTDTGTLHSWGIKVYGHRAGDTVPRFDGETINNKEYVEGRTITTETLPAATGGNEPLTYSITPELPAGLSFNSSTRMIRGTPISAASGTYTYTVTDEDGDTDELSFGITVEADRSPTFGGATVTNQEYIAGILITPQTLPVATEGNAPLTYSITPELPAGLSFNEAIRELSGTPTTAALETTYTYTVTDEDGDENQITFRITVGADMPTFDGESISTQHYTVGRQTTSETLPEAAGGDGVLTYSINLPLPTGLSFNSVTRTISGIPTRASIGNYMYRVIDEDKDMDELSFTIKVTTPTVLLPPTQRPPTRGPTSVSDAGGGGGCAISGQNEVASDLLVAVASLMLIPVSVIIRKKRRSQINT